ncbi:D-alanyl-D-alanine carboxypeptidase family protein [Nevskia sp.]|uniref:D-alanyl-D-alanine carboxypeptidase family protein n=1 Tax=Nevskia sp. TaxID=1929292 RepID=UPI0025E94622|nr:D-alanyl-D-alanine carboxypeptidase family protein [Nevskia sp.]
MNVSPVSARRPFRHLLLVAATVAAVLAPVATPVSAATIPAAPTIDAKAFALLDYDSGELLAGNNPDGRVEPASITKVMTTYVAFDEIRKGRLKLDDTALVSEKAWRQGKDSSESRMFLTLGSRVKIEDLLRGIIIVSGNDASIVLAEHLAGSEDAFADLMNETAKKLGMVNSHFVDASGLPNAEHYTTAHDLAILGRALIRDFPEFYKIYAERSFKYGIEHAQENRNGLLIKDPTVDGIKTGHTSAAGYCLLSSSVRDGRRLISAVMGAPSWAYREQASLELLNYGFRFFETASLFGATAPVGSLKVYKGTADTVQIGTLEPLKLTLPRGAKESLQIQQQIDPRAIAPLTAGQKLGTATISIDGKPLKTIDLVALTDVPSGGFWRRLIDQIKLWLGF